MEDRTLRQRQADEAEARLRMLVEAGMLQSVLADFREEGRLYVSERAVYFGEAVGVLYWADQYPEVMRAVERAEQELGCVVYHVTRERTWVGELLDLFCVSEHEEEWEMDREELSQGCSLAYVVNLDDETCSEFGGIGFRAAAGGIVRTA